MPGSLPSLPAVHRVLAHRGLGEALARLGRTAVRDAVRTTLSEAREATRAGGPTPTLSEVVALVRAALGSVLAPAYPGVVNATGVLIHTNLGRAPRLAVPAPDYLALEMSLETGERGERLGPVVDRLRRYFGSEAATVVTNNAAALFLMLSAHARDRDVIVSRGELIEIGGSFRLPEIMVAAGARLVEVGCTNRTHLRDFEAALTGDTAAILVVHRSNFHMDGFVASPALAELVALGRRRGVPVWVDQGSGCHLDLASFGLRHEETVQEILAAGAEAVLFSGDKLLAGPQAGIIVGSTAAVAPLGAHPLRRALRPDKSALVSLAATLDAFLAGLHERAPLYRLMAVAPEELHRRARRLAARLRRAGVAAAAVATRAVIGGGTTPDQTLASWAVELPAGTSLAARLRVGQPPVIARIDNGRLVADLRAVPPESDGALLAAILAAAECGPSS